MSVGRIFSSVKLIIAKAGRIYCLQSFPQAFHGLQHSPRRHVEKVSDSLFCWHSSTDYPQGEVLSQYVLDPKLQHYSSYICYSNAAACTVSTGKIIYNNKGYHSDWYYTAYMGCTSKENGNTITVTVYGKNPYELVFEFVLTKTSETQLAVISSTNTAHVPVGIVFVKQ